MNQFHIRPFLPSDQPAARTLILNGLGERFGYIDSALNPDLDDIWQNYVQKGHIFVVAEVAGELVGTGAVVRQNQPYVFSDTVCGRLVRMSVSPPYRRLGIGQKLVHYLLQLAERQVFGRLWLETNLDWYDAIRLYERCGFVEYARDSESVYLAKPCNTAVLSGV